MKRVVFLFCILSQLSTLFMQAQTARTEIIWGDEDKASRRETLSKIIGVHQNGFYALKSKQDFWAGNQYSFTIEEYNNDLNPIKTSVLETNDGIRHNVIDIVKILDKYYLFSSVTDGDAKTKTLYVHDVNMATMKVENNARKIAELEYSSNWKANKGMFMTSSSGDGKKVLAFYTMQFERGEKQKIGFCVMDPEMNPLWSRNITLPYNDELCDVEGYHVDNLGNVYLQCTIYKDKHRKKRKGEPNYEYVLLKYVKDIADAEVYNINLPDKFLTDMQFSILDNQNIVCAGFYSEKGTFSIKGSFYLTIDSRSKSIEKISYKEFSIDFVVENMTERQKKKVEKKLEEGKNVEMYEYDLKDIIIRKDGGAILCGEQYYEYTSITAQVSSNGATTTVTTNYYYYNDIIVVSINPNGDIDWVTKIPKRQSTTNDDGFFSSYYMSIINQKMYFIFNDNAENLLEKTNDSNKFKRFTGQKGAIVALVELDFNGNFTKRSLLNNADAEVIVRPKVCSSLSGNQVLLFGQKGKSQRFARVTFL